MINEMGSIWRKWDLHVHTPDSVLNCQFNGQTPEAKWANYLQSLDTLKGIAVLGITDYFSISGFNRVRDYQRGGGLQNIDLIIPNVELRITPVTDVNKPINLHILFNPLDSVISCLETDFFASLKHSYQENYYPCTHEGLVRLGRAYRNNASLSEEIAYKDGVEQFKTTIKDLREILTSHKILRDNCLIGVSNSNRDGASGIKHCSLATTREDIYLFADLIFSGNPEDRAYFLGYGGTDDRNTIKRKYGHLKPCVHGSDAHSNDFLGHPCAKRGIGGHNCTTNRPECDLRFCWIKAEPTFEGLKQVAFEPEFRVKIQTDNPSESETYAKIENLVTVLPENLQITDECKNKTDFCFSGKYDIAFSNNLTGIIGGRGSGKSTLIHLMYNSWPNPDKPKLATTSSPLNNLDIINPLKTVSESTKCKLPNQTEFFLQNEIESAAQSLEAMSQLITHRLDKLSSIEGPSLADIKKNWAIKLNAFDEVIVAFDKLSSLQSQIDVLTGEIDTLKKQTEVIKSEEYIKHQEEIANISAAITRHASFEADNAKLKSQLDTMIDLVDQLNWKDDQGSRFILRRKIYFEKLKVELDRNLMRVQNDYASKSYQEKLNDKKIELKKYLDARGLSSENIEEITDANQQIIDKEELVRSLKSEKLPYEKIFGSKANRLAEYWAAFENYRTRVIQVTESLQKKLSDLALSNKEIRFCLERDFTNLKSNCTKFINANVKASLRTDALESIFFEKADIGVLVESPDAIRKKFETSIGSEKTRSTLQEYVGDDVFVQKMHLRIAKDYGDINAIRIQTTLGGKMLKNTSFGERCGVAIAIILVAGTNPIIIDQPEDHLDGKFIAETLVPLLKKQKQNRQIILVSRDANIVVGGDAELIHILESESNASRTKVIPSTIEDISNRDKYIWILDGGKDAFQKREQKYQIQD
ncbi:MAG: hypothetical protein A2Y12_18500 [Planctomycetes bacterium GWF2_42_9]|nr:MAG: hypothetical protein A2Y12_18500 [Planctomycetes bacterium GWF2_42_9]